jgi:hypothetical protein
MSDVMNTPADRDRRQRFGAQRGRDFYWGITLGLAVNVATMFMISLGVGCSEIGSYGSNCG